MKRIYFSIILLAVTIGTVFSQVPNAFNYQAVVRNSSGEIIANKTVSFKISLLKDSDSGAVVYSETHSVLTNKFGLVNFKIGEGTKLSGAFSPADWGEVIFTKVEIDPAGGSSYSHLATTKFASVPYAFMAQTVVNDEVDDADADPANEIQTLSISGTLLELSNGGGSVTLPSSGGGSADNWGTQTVVSDATLTGAGTTANPLSVVADGDGDDTNEIQALTKTGNIIELSNSGGSIYVNESPFEYLANIFDYSGDNTFKIDDANPVLRTKSALSLSRPPLAKLEVSTDADRSALRLYNSSIYASLDIYNSIGSGLSVSNSSNRASAYFYNSGDGPAVEFGNKIVIADGTEGDGKVLTSDADGVASWQTPAAGGSSLWTESGGNVYRSAGNVGIGTTSPSSLMDIQGSSATLRLKASSMNAVVYLDRFGSTNHAYILHRTGGVNKFYVGLLGDDNYWINSGSSSTFKGLKVEPDGDVKMSDNLYVEGDLEVNQNLEVADDLDAANMSFSSGEISKSTTGTGNNLLPFAYGTITKTGGKIGCTSNVGTVTRYNKGDFIVNITNLGTDYTVVITPYGGAAYVTGAVYRRTDDKFRGTIWDTKNDAYYDGGFSFIVYKP